MKILSILLALLTLSLSSSPCCVPDLSIHEQENLTCVEQSSCCATHDEESEGEESEERCDNCSPFYTCGMGGGCTLSYFDSFSILSAYFENQYMSLNASKFDSEYQQAMWQPPKFV
jgi:hypothetical protein